jgi:diketogulonate reductase-like aldo/keto reductase
VRLSGVTRTGVNWSAALAAVVRAREIKTISAGLRGHTPTTVYLDWDFRAETLVAPGSTSSAARIRDGIKITRRLPRIGGEINQESRMSRESIR